MIELQPFSSSASLTTRALNSLGLGENLMSAHAYKQQAARLSEHISAVHKFRLKQASALEAIAAVHGARDWNTLLAEDQPQASAPLPQEMPQEALSYLFPQSHRFSDTAFCDAILNLTSLVCGGPKAERQAVVDHLVARQIARRGGFVFVDLDSEPKLHQLEHAMANVGRAPELGVLSLIESQRCDSINPLACSNDPGVLAELVTRLLNVIPRHDDNPGADFYQQTAHYVLSNIFGALLSLAEVPTFERLSRILARPAEGLAELEAQLIDGSSTQAAFALMLEGYRKRGKNGFFVDEDRFRAAVGGLGGRCAMLSRLETRSGDLMLNTTTPTLSWADVMQRGRGVYVQPSMGANTDTLENLMLGCLCAALGSARSDGSSCAKVPPFTIFVVGALHPNWARKLAKRARSAGAGLVLATEETYEQNLPAVDLNIKVEAAGGFGRPAIVSLRNTATQQLLRAELEEFKGWPVPR